MSKNTKRILISAGVLLLAAAMILAFMTFSKKPVEGSKTIEISITHKDGTEKKITLHTDAQYLLDAIKEYDEDLLQGEQAQYGLYIKTVNGMLADFDVDQTFWSFTIAGETAMTGVDQTELVDGTVYGLVRTK